MEIDDQPDVPSVPCKSKELVRNIPTQMSTIKATIRLFLFRESLQLLMCTLEKRQAM